MLRIYLTRHGQDEDNAKGILNGWRDSPLTPLGIEQARKLVAKIKDDGLDFGTVYTSPLRRAYQTAEAVTNSMDLRKPSIMEDLKERNFGVMTGKPVEDIEKTCSPDIIKTSNVVYFLSPEGAETFPDLIRRGSKVVSWVKDHHDDGNVLLVTHGDIGKMIYAAYYDLDWKKVLTMFHFGNSELLLLAEDSAPEDAHVFSAEQHNL